ncbi:MAG: hypothetical protein K0S65_2747 [Labilithrix sp.]|nr:hypothetical protein [Labilithrix sp.]
MSVDLILNQTNASGPLVPSTLTGALGLLAKLAGAHAPKATMRGQELRIAAELPLSDAACTAFLLDFVGQGRLVHGVAHGPSAAALVWAFHALARAVKCTLRDNELEHDVAPDPDAHRDAAASYLAEYEAGVRQHRRPRHLHAEEEEPGGEAAALLAWLAREEHIALASESAPVAALAQELPLDDPSALYEMLLDSDAVDDVFVSERELTSLIARFRARDT